MLKACAFEYLVNKNTSIWCKFFDNKVLKLLGYREDLKLNCIYGNRHEINKLMTCDLVEYIIISLMGMQQG